MSTSYYNEPTSPSSVHKHSSFLNASMLSTQQIGGTKSPIQFNHDGNDSRNNESDYFNHNFVNRSTMHPLPQGHHNHSKQHRTSSYMAGAGSTSYQTKQQKTTRHNNHNMNKSGMMLEPLRSSGPRQSSFNQRHQMISDNAKSVSK